MANTTERVLRARIQLVDNYTQPVQRALSVAKKFEKLKNLVSTLSAKDLASKVINKAMELGKRFAKNTWSAIVSVKDKASSILNSIAGKMSMLAGGVTIGVALKAGMQGLMEEETQKITIGRVIENSGQTKEQAQKSTEEYYKYLTEYANKTPFETSAVQQFGTKAMMISSGNIDQAKNLTGSMGNVKAFVGNLRTETEVAEAFFSASNGNMEMLNNMLGEQYNTFDEALAGISKKQGGLVNEMSSTTGGLWSTIVGKSKDAMKEFVKVYEKPIKDVMTKVIGFLDKISPVLVSTGDKLLLFYQQIQESGELSATIDFFKNIFTVAWNAIKTAIESARPFIEKVFNFLITNAPFLTLLVETFGAVWSSLWKTAMPLLEGAWTLIEPTLQNFVDLISGILTVVKDVHTWWGKMVDKIKNNPVVETVGKLAKAMSGGGNGNDGTAGSRNAFGSGRIARNGEVHRLHEGEKVLTKAQANAYDKGLSGGVNISIGSMIVREEADINKIANTLYRKIKEASNVAVVGV